MDEKCIWFMNEKTEGYWFRNSASYNKRKNDTITVSYNLKATEGKQCSESMLFILDHIYH